MSDSVRGLSDVLKIYCLKTSRFKDLSDQSFESLPDVLSSESEEKLPTHDRHVVGVVMQ